jgi:hypothetical protein
LVNYLQWKSTGRWKERARINTMLRDLQVQFHDITSDAARHRRLPE